MKRSSGMLSTCGVLLGSCASWTSAQKGTAIGAGAGAVIGNAVGVGVLGTVGGANVGGVVGHEIGKNQDQKKVQK